jgi:molybdopterin-binding protein
VDEFTTTEAAELLGVSGDTVRRWVSTGRLRAEKTGARGRQLIAGTDLARFANAHAEQKPPGSTGAISARNRFIGLVTAVKQDQVMAQVDMVCGPHRLVALISSEAVKELGLAPGVRAVAEIKATNVVVERPSR